MDKQVNPERKLPGGVVHIVSSHESGILVTDVWNDEASAKAFYDGAAAAIGQSPPPMTY